MVNSGTWIPNPDAAIAIGIVGCAPRDAQTGVGIVKMIFINLSPMGEITRGTFMLKNFFKVALRNLLKRKG
ncbi:MAG TPA: hypothetical protein VFP87_01170, partial [Chitinophagaceae bacterium]|nr:hypothetical protein [Chitinophagaceae bacterium]